MQIDNCSLSLRQKLRSGTTSTKQKVAQRFTIALFHLLGFENLAGLKKEEPSIYEQAMEEWEGFEGFTELGYRT